MVLLFTKLLLGGKNDLKKVWLAAHWEKKLKRYQITQIDIESSVQDMMAQEIILDLRLSGHLLVGIVRIFSRKTKYLLTECNDIFNRVRIFRGALTDLPPNKSQARLKDITIPETFDDLNFGKIDEDALFLSNRAQSEYITLKETVGNSCLINDDFDELNFDEGNNGIMFEDDFEFISLFNEKEEQENKVRKVSDQSVINSEDEKNFVDDDTEMDCCNGEGFQTGSDSSTASSNKLLSARHISVSQDLILIREKMLSLKSNEKIELNLEPLSDTLLNAVRRRRKRKLIIDEVRTLDKERLRKNFFDTSDIVVPLDLAPPSKRLMVLKEIGESGKIFRLPGQKFGSVNILKIFTKKLKTYKTDYIDESMCEEGSSCSFPSIELPAGDMMLNEQCVAEELMEVNGEPMDFAEGMEGNDVELSIENSNSIVHESVLHKESINFSSELQLDISVFENTVENVHFILQDRIIGLLNTLKAAFCDSDIIKFSELVQEDRKIKHDQIKEQWKKPSQVSSTVPIKVARKFFSLLMLKKFAVVELQQEKSYNEISITPGANFLSACIELC